MEREREAKKQMGRVREHFSPILRVNKFFLVETGFTGMRYPPVS